MRHSRGALNNCGVGTHDQGVHQIIVRRALNRSDGALVVEVRGPSHQMNARSLCSCWAPCTRKPFLGLHKLHSCYRCKCGTVQPPAGYTTVSCTAQSYAQAAQLQKVSTWCSATSCWVQHNFKQKCLLAQKFLVEHSPYNGLAYCEQFPRNFEPNDPGNDPSWPLTWAQVSARVWVRARAR
eukprot:scaffold138564_cov20-Tisochrysis_lutea.AAC.2